MNAWGRKLYFTVFVAAIIFAMLASWRSFVIARESMRAANAGLEESSRLINDMERLRNSPRMASLEVEPPDRIAARVTAAAAQAQLPPLCIQSVDPRSPVKVNQSAYQIRATGIVLQNAQLAQVAAFVQGLEDASSGTTVRDLTISRSSAVVESDIELWNVRLTLTQMIFSPISGR
ncbi:MAG: hypothetical protein ABL921_02835 [Pirellula sp.]